MAVHIADVVVTFVLGAAGLLLSASWYRDRQLRIAEERLSAYRKLWMLTQAATPTRLERGGQGPLTRDEAGKLYETLTGWYYEEGHGMLLTLSTRDMYLVVKEQLRAYSLGKVPEDLPAPNSPLDREKPWTQRSNEPAEAFETFRRYIGLKADKRLEALKRLDALAKEPQALSKCRVEWHWDQRTTEWNGGARRIRELSLLRTQMKLDLDIFGFTYWRKRTKDDEQFLKRAHFNPKRWGRKRWYRRWCAGNFGRWAAHKG
jgi:hypothetical protein